MIPRAPAIPTCRTAPGRSSASWRAVVAAASTGPTPQASPGWSQSSIRSRRRAERCAYPREDPTTRRPRAGTRDGAASPRAMPRTTSPARRRRTGESRERGGSTRAGQAAPLPRSSSSTSSRSRFRPRWSSTQPAARAFFTQFRSPYGATSQRPSPSSHDRDRCRPGRPGRPPGHGEDVRVRAGEPEPRERPNDRVERAPPDALCGTASVLLPRRATLPREHTRPPLAGRSRRHRVSRTQISARAGGSRVNRIAR